MIRIQVIVLSLLVGYIAASYDNNYDNDGYYGDGEMDTNQVFTAEERSELINEYLEDGRQRREKALESLGDYDQRVLRRNLGLRNQKIQTRGNCPLDFGMGCGRMSNYANALTRLYAERRARIQAQEEAREAQRKQERENRRTPRPHKVHTTTEEPEHYTKEPVVDYTEESSDRTPEPVDNTGESEMEIEDTPEEEEMDENPEEAEGKDVCPEWVITHMSPCCKGWIMVERECSSEVPDYCADSCVGKPRMYEKCESDVVYKTSCSPIYRRNTLEQEPEDKKGNMSEDEY